MKSRLSLVLVLCIALLGAYVHAQFGTKPSDLSTIRVKDDLFVIYNDLVPGNTTVLVTNQGIDPRRQQVRDRLREPDGADQEDLESADPLRRQHALSR